MKPRILEVRTKILKKNDELAREMREQFRETGVCVINLVSSPGTGKTAFLEKTLTMLKELGISTAAIVGDLETDNDAKRLAKWSPGQADHDARMLSSRSGCRPGSSQRLVDGRL